MRWIPAAASVLAIAALASACSGGDRTVEIRWEAAASGATLVEERAGFAAAPIETVVYVSNGTDTVLRGAVLRLSELEAEKLVGFGIGTITNTSTSFDGETRVWALGDLKPGARVGFPIGLWFSSQYLSASPDSLALVIELASPDLSEPVKSNALVLSLAR